MHASLPYRLLLVGCWTATTFTAAVAQAPAGHQPQAQVQAQASAAPQAGRSDPLNAQAAVPAAAHVSAFATYRVAGEPQVGNWNEANRTVTRIGGWRAYAREAGASSPAAAADPAPRSPTGHAGHRDKP